MILLVIIGLVLIGRGIQCWVEDSPPSQVRSRIFYFYKFAVLLALIYWMEAIAYALTSVTRSLYSELGFSGY